MKIKQLTSRADGTVEAILVRFDGQDVDVRFTTSYAGGVAVANPDKPVFDREPVDAAGVRAIVAAVLAFDLVAANSVDDE